jgi:rhomboid protease GluP
VAVFAAFVLATGSFFEPTQQELIRWGADYGPLTTSGQWWRLLTSTFLHGGVIHLIFNMQCLQFLGPIAERAFGRAAFLLGYLGTAICASLASQFFHPNQVCVGASGTIFGIAGLLITPIAFKRLSLSAKQLANPLKSLLAFAGFNLAFGAIVPGIDNAAHIGGFISGLTVGIVFALRHRKVDMEREAAPKDIAEQPASS